MIKDYLESDNLDRIALVGANSQGKSYMLDSEFKKDKETVYVTNEVKADENLKNSTDTSTLVSWLNSMLDMNTVKATIQDEIDKIDLSGINTGSFLNIKLDNELGSCKGLIGTNIETDSNKWKKPGAGERFLGQLLLISKILEGTIKQKYKYFVIDEPEQHLHPSLYIKVAKLLNKISHQGINVIIATHSPTIVQYFIEDTNEIIKINDGQCFQLPTKKSLIEISQKFDCYTKEDMSFSNYKKIEPYFDLYFENFVLPIIIKSLFCRIMLLGEGAIERKIFDLYVLKYGSNMEKTDIDYGIVDGKIFFPIILRILKELNVKTLTLFDIDNSSDKIHSYLNQIIFDLSSGSISFKSNIEDSLGITKIEKYMEATILMNEYYINNEKKLLDLLETIDNKIKTLMTL